MRRAFYLLLSAATIGSASASKVGDTYDQVIAEKGPPVSRLESGAIQILSYADGTIKLRDNVVVSIRAPEPIAPATSAAAAPRPTPAPIVQPTLAPQAQDAPSHATWTTDYGAALEQAKNEHRYVFLFFTGSDWCGWCKKLNREILRTNEFAQYAQEKLVLVELDFPHQKPQSYELQVQNRTLSGRFNITGFPTVIVLDYTGKPVARLGYQAGGPGPFIDRLRALGE